MKRVQIHNQNRKTISPLVARYCTSFFCRLRGLTFRRNLDENEGLLLVQSRENRADSAIHMLFVFMDLTVIWINSNFEVVDVKLARRWRLFYLPKSDAQYVLEISPARLSEFEIGDTLNFEEVFMD